MSRVHVLARVTTISYNLEIVMIYYFVIYIFDLFKKQGNFIRSKHQFFWPYARGTAFGTRDRVDRDTTAPLQGVHP